MILEFQQKTISLTQLENKSAVLAKTFQKGSPFILLWATVQTSVMKVTAVSQTQWSINGFYNLHQKPATTAMFFFFFF